VHKAVIKIDVTQLLILTRAHIEKGAYDCVAVCSVCCSVLQCVACVRIVLQCTHRKGCL